MQSSQVPSKFPIPFANSAGSQYIRTIPEASQIGIQGGAASLTDGFPPLTFLPVGAGGIPPFGQDFNGILNEITQWTQFSNCSGGLTTFDATYASEIGGYPKGAVLLSSTFANNALVWISATDNNSLNPDVTLGGSGAWVLAATSAGIQNEAYISADDTGSANAIVLAPKPAPNAYVKYQRFQSKIANTVTGSTLGSVTVNLVGASGSLGAKSLIFPNGNPPSPYMLMAGQIGMFVYDGTYFQLENAVPSLIVPATAPTIYVRTDGNDTNTGSANTSSSAMQTIQGAVNRGTQTYSLAGTTLNVVMGTAGTYAPFVINGNFGNISVQGLTASPSSYIIGTVATNTNGLINVAGQTTVTLQNLTASSVSNVNTVVATLGGAIILNNVVVKQTTTSFGAVAVEQGGLVIIEGNTTITTTSSAGEALIATGGGAMDVGAGLTINITGTYSAAVAVASSGSVIVFNSGVTMTGSPTGTRYSVSLNGVLDTNTGSSTFIPGSVAGTTSTGGQYA
jgi:hypothetical protein